MTKQASTVPVEDVESPLDRITCAQCQYTHADSQWFACSKCGWTKSGRAPTASAPPTETVASVPKTKLSALQRQLAEARSAAKTLAVELKGVEQKATAERATRTKIEQQQNALARSAAFQAGEEAAAEKLAALAKQHNAAGARLERLEDQAHGLRVRVAALKDRVETLETLTELVAKKAVLPHGSALAILEGLRDKLKKKVVATAKGSSAKSLGAVFQEFESAAGICIQQILRAAARDHSCGYCSHLMLPRFRYRAQVLARAHAMESRGAVLDAKRDPAQVYRRWIVAQKERYTPYLGRTARKIIADLAQHFDPEDAQHFAREIKVCPIYRAILDRIITVRHCQSGLRAWVVRQASRAGEDSIWDVLRACRRAQPFLDLFGGCLGGYNRRRKALVVRFATVENMLHSFVEARYDRAFLDYLEQVLALHRRRKTRFMYFMLADGVGVSDNLRWFLEEDAKTVDVAAIKLPQFGGYRYFERKGADQLAWRDDPFAKFSISLGSAHSGPILAELEDPLARLDLMRALAVYRRERDRGSIACYGKIKPWFGTDAAGLFADLVAHDRLAPLDDTSAGPQRRGSLLSEFIHFCLYHQLSDGYIWPKLDQALQGLPGAQLKDGRNVDAAFGPLRKAKIGNLIAAGKKLAAILAKPETMREILAEVEREFGGSMRTVTAKDLFKVGKKTYSTLKLFVQKQTGPALGVDDESYSSLERVFALASTILALQGLYESFQATARTGTLEEKDLRKSFVSTFAIGASFEHLVSIGSEEMARAAKKYLPRTLLGATLCSYSVCASFEEYSRASSLGLQADAKLHLAMAGSSMIGFASMFAGRTLQIALGMTGFGLFVGALIWYLDFGGAQQAAQESAQRQLSLQWLATLGSVHLRKSAETPCGFDVVLDWFQREDLHLVAQIPEDWTVFDERGAPDHDLVIGPKLVWEEVPGAELPYRTVLPAVMWHGAAARLRQNPKLYVAVLPRRAFGSSSHGHERRLVDTDGWANRVWVTRALELEMSVEGFRPTGESSWKHVKLAPKAI